jgi:hypothetical protein
MVSSAPFPSISGTYEDIEDNDHTGVSTSSKSKADPTRPSPSSVSKEPQAPVKGDYERTRELNIARNQVVLRILDKSIASGEESGALIEELEKIGVKLDEEELKGMLSK